MTHLLTYENVAQYLSSVLQQRKDANSAYSLRAFARDLGVAPSTLSEVMSGRKGISRSMVDQIIRKLKLSNEESSFFKLLADPKIKRASNQIEKAKQALEAVRNRKVLSLEVFQMISEWHHLTLLEALKKDVWRKDLHGVASLLGISVETVVASIKRLKKLGLVDANNKTTDGQVATVQDTPSQAIRAHHQAILRKALKAIDEQSVDERDLQTSHMIFNRADLPLVKEKIREFQGQLIRDFGSDPVLADDIYCLAIQFFNLTHKPKEGI